MIGLPFGGGAVFNEHDLVDYIRAFRPPRDYIIIGASKVVMAKHRKPHSLDYWLRQRSRNRNTMQAVTSVIDDLIAARLFVVEDDLPCPDSHRRCKGLRLKH